MYEWTVHCGECLWNLVKFRLPAAIINKQLRLDLRLETLSSLEVYERLTDCLSVGSSTDCSKLAGAGSHRWHHHHHHKQTHTWSWSILVAPQQINSSSSNLSLWASRENSQQQPLTMSTVASANVDGDQWTEVLGISSLPSLTIKQEIRRREEFFVLTPCCRVVRS